MTAFIVKSAVCMILLFGLYWMLLRKEKLFTFNRYFLIISVIISFVVPFISIPVHIVNENQTKEIMSRLYSVPEKPSTEGIKAVIEEPHSEPLINQSTASAEVSEGRSISTGKIFLVIYFLGFALMLFRFCRNIFTVRRLYMNAELIENEYYDIALIQNKINPFSFLRTVYLNRDEYFGDLIAPNVISHELQHVRQFHSRDIIFFELVHIVFWFNPVLFLIKRAARINHEYLADEAVIHTMPDIQTYAIDLINFVSRRVGVPFTSGFSPSMIRLRLLMLNTNTSRRVRNFRISGSLAASLLLLTALSFSPEDDDPQNRRNIKQVTGNDTIVVEEVFFRGPDFSPLKALIVFNGKKLDYTDTLTVDPKQIKFIDILNNRDAKRKYGKKFNDGVVEISTYGDARQKLSDSVVYRQLFTVNHEMPEGTIKIPVSKLYSSSIWTYPVFPNQATEKPWRTVSIMTRDFYKIRGKVITDNGKPLPGVFVTATDHPHGVTTDKEGRFLLEDVRQGSMAELTADGYDPLFFRVSGALHTLDMKITLEKEGTSEHKPINMSVSYVIRDFTGSWRVNWEQSKPLIPRKSIQIYDINQYDGDSLLISLTRITDKEVQYKEDKELFIFNTVKTEVRNESKHRISCRISSDGQAFTVTHELVSLFGLSNDYKIAEKYSLSPDGKKLFIHSYSYPDINSLNGEETAVRVFDKI